VRLLIFQLDFEDYEEEEDDDEASSAEESEPKEKDSVEDARPTKATDASVVATQLSSAIANMKLSESEAPSEHTAPIDIMDEPIDGANDGPESKGGARGGVGEGITSTALPAVAR
jgi:hypothetical protein